MDDTEDGVSHALEIDADYERVPSEITQRLNDLKGNVDGKEYQIARDNILSLMKLGGDALSEISALAMQTSHPRMFETFTALMKTMIEANRELMEVKRIEEKSKEDMANSDGPVIDGNATNVLINCTPAQMIEMMKEAKEAKK